MLNVRMEYGLASDKNIYYICIAIINVHEKIKNYLLKIPFSRRDTFLLYWTFVIALSEEKVFLKWENT